MDSTFPKELWSIIMEKLIDLTHTIINMQPVYPGDEPTMLSPTEQLTRDSYTNHRLQISMHSGTHMDLPMHLLKSDKYVSDYPIETFIGNGCIIDARNQSFIKMKKEYVDRIIEGSIVLILTGQDKKFGTKEYFDEFPVIDEEFATILVAKKIRIVGIDSPSPDKFPFPVHKILLKSNIPIIENLTNLELLLNEKRFEVIALPLKIKADSSILRVAARILS